MTFAPFRLRAALLAASLAITFSGCESDAATDAPTDDEAVLRASRQADADILATRNADILATRNAEAEAVADSGRAMLKAAEENTLFVPRQNPQPLTDAQAARQAALVAEADAVNAAAKAMRQAAAEYLTTGAPVLDPVKLPPAKPGATPLVLAARIAAAKLVIPGRYDRVTTPTVVQVNRPSTPDESSFEKGAVRAAVESVFDASTRFASFGGLTRREANGAKRKAIFVALDTEARSLGLVSTKNGVKNAPTLMVNTSVKTVPRGLLVAHIVTDTSTGEIVTEGSETAPAN